MTAGPAASDGPGRTPDDGAHRRYNPLLDEWVLCSPHRLDRPWQGSEEPDPHPSRPAYDPSCYLCPGNERANGQRNPAYTGTFAFDNDFPALLHERRPARPEGHSLLTREPASGVCRVVCFSPRHDLSLARMPAAARRDVVLAWREESAALARRPSIAYVQLFENCGEAMGCSNPHPHCQIWGTDHVPTLPARKHRTQTQHHAALGGDLLGDYLAIELERRVRIVIRDDAWVALVPFWAVWPFEIMILPVRRVASFAEVDGDEASALADVLGELHARYDNLFRTTFPYSVGWHPAPCDSTTAAWRLHATYYPPLLRSATVRKFVVGYELSAEPQRDLTPEAAASMLRAQPPTHYQGVEP